MECETSPPAKVWNKSIWVINVLTCVIICVMTIYVSYIPFLRYHFLFTWHVALGTVAYLLFFPPSFLIFDNSWCLGLTRKHKSWIHAILSGAGSILGLICVILEYYRKALYIPQYPEITHFESAHAITGLIAVLLLITANISGVLTASVTWFNKKFTRPVTVKLYHNILGQVALIMGIISLCLAFHIPWFTRYTSFGTRLSLTIFTVLVTVWSLVNSIISARSQIYTLLDS